MPVALPRLTADQFEDAVAARKGRYPPALVERLKGKKLLQWAVTHPSNIASANFLAGAHKAKGLPGAFAALQAPEAPPAQC